LWVYPPRACRIITIQQAAPVKTLIIEQGLDFVGRLHRIHRIRQVAGMPE
jgi:hypothetical protein